MSQISIVQSAWTKGQISTKLNARSDVQNMLTFGASVLENFVIIQQGGITKRPGTKYISTCDDLVLIPFKNSLGSFIISLTGTKIIIRDINANFVITNEIDWDTTSYLDDVTLINYAQDDTTMMFTYKDIPPMILVMTEYGVCTFGEFTASIPPAYDFNTIDYDAYAFILSNITNTGSTFEIGDQIGIAAYQATDDKTAEENAEANTGTADGGAVSLSADYTGGIFVGEGCTFAIKSTQTTSFPQGSVISASTTTTFESINSIPDKYVFNSSDVTFTPSASDDYTEYAFIIKNISNPDQAITANDEVKIGVYKATSSKTAFENAEADIGTVEGGAVTFSNDYVGYEIYATDAAFGSVYNITITITSNYTYPTYLVAELLENDLVDQLDDKTIISGGSSYLAEPLMNSTHGYPEACAFYQDRLWFGGFRDVPNLIIASEISKYGIFESGTALDTDPLNFKLSSDVTARIKHIVATKTMFLLTDIGEFAFLSTSGTGTITPSNVNITLQTKNGTTECKPQELDDQLFYVQYGGSVIRGTDYSYTSNSYQALNVSILSPELINNPVDSCTIKNIGGDDNSYLIYVNKDGSIACLQSVQSENISGWTKWISKNREFKSVCSIGNRSFCLVYNTNGDFITLEEFDIDTYLDCQVDIILSNGVGTSSVPINNASILLDTGQLYQLDNDTPTDTFNVGNKSGNGICGVTIYSTMTTTPYSLRDTQIGDLLFVPKKLSRIYVYYYQSLGINVSIDNNTKLISNWKYDQSTYDTAPTVITDVHEIDVYTDWNLLSSITINQSIPYPVTILSMGVTINF